MLTEDIAGSGSGPGVGRLVPPDAEVCSEMRTHHCTYDSWPIKLWNFCKGTRIVI